MRKAHRERRWTIYLALVTGQRAKICEKTIAEREKYFGQLFEIADHAATLYKERTVD
jgi:hypothetical protein